MEENEVKCLISRMNKHMVYENEDTILNCILAWYNFSDFEGNINQILKENINWSWISNKFLKDVLILPWETPILESEVFKENICKEINIR